jgi:prevent-host-death family protein
MAGRSEVGIMAGTAATVVDVHEAKSRLSRLLALVEAGEEVVIVRDGRPVARLVSIAALRPVRRFGAMRGLVTVDDSFFEPLPEEELAAWE